jgi:hypothetical protein
MQLSLVALPKEKERFALKIENRARVISRETEGVNKILPSPLTFQCGDEAENLDKALDKFDSLFSSL